MFHHFSVNRKPIIKIHQCFTLGTKVRLQNGANPSEGRVEILHNSQWGTICNHGFDESDARVICRMLGFDS